VFLALAPLAGVSLGLESFALGLGVLVLMSLALAGVGFSLAWVMDSSAGFHGVMMVFLMPMLLLSGAFFPAEGTHPILGFLMAVNPLTYAVSLLRHALYAGTDAITALPSVTLCLAVTVAFAVGTFALGTRIVLRRTARDAV